MGSRLDSYVSLLARFLVIFTVTKSITTSVILLFSDLYVKIVVGAMAAFLVATITHRALNFVERRLDRGAYVLHLFPILATITLLVTSSVLLTSPIGVAIALSVNLVIPAALAYLIVRAGLYPRHNAGAGV